MRNRSLGTLILFLVLTFAVVGFGAAFPPGDWYAALDKPSWNPPNYLFGPVWTVLYVLIAIAGWRISRTEKPRPALVAWGFQLLLNGLWSWIFFGLHRPDLALAEIIVLWVAIGVTVGLFARRDKFAAWLLIPYWLWVSFASALNFQLWKLNA